MPVISHDAVEREAFRGGAQYQTLVGNDAGSSPIRLGVQTSPPGYRTPVHSHPYLETITIMEGHGEAWLEGSDDIVELHPGVTLVLPPNVKHWFGATGDEPLVTLGVHASGERIVDVHEG